MKKLIFLCVFAISASAYSYDDTTEFTDSKPYVKDDTEDFESSYQNDYNTKVISSDPYGVYAAVWKNIFYSKYKDATTLLTLAATRTKEDVMHTQLIRLYIALKLRNKVLVKNIQDQIQEDIRAEYIED